MRATEAARLAAWNASDAGRAARAARLAAPVAAYDAARGAAKDAAWDAAARDARITYYAARAAYLAKIPVTR